MIKVIGARRVAILIALVVVNALLAAATYLYMVPEEAATEKKLRNLRSANQVRSADVERMQVEFEQLGQQQDRFDALKKDGFFKVQVRSEAKSLFKEIQDESRVISAVAVVHAGTIEENEEAKKSNYKVLVSPVEILIEAFDDLDVYNYIHILERRFPGHLAVDELKIGRTMDISGPVLRAIATGGNPVLIKASLKLSWRTMIPESKIIVEEK